MIAVPVARGSSFQSGEPRILFSTADYHINAFHPQFEPSPDGQRFVISRQVAGTTLGVVVVFNFLEELKRRMAAR